MEQFQILHISDLHITEKEKFDTSVVLDPLIERVKEDRDKGLKPKIVVASGDVAFSGKKAEYDLAKTFFDKLLGCLKIGPERLFIVPGNHDVNRKAYPPSHIPAYATMKDLSYELENYLDDLLRGMNDYFRFIEKHYPHLKSGHGRLIPFVNAYDATCGKKIAIVGLNSAWMCRKSQDKKEIALGEYQIKNAMEEMEKLGKFDLRINIFHHPLSWLWPEDRNICRKYFNDSILLCGHLHDAEGEYREDLQGATFQFLDGAAYLGSDSRWPNRFQYITFDWDKNEIVLDYRKFDKNSREWCLEGEKGDGGKKTFSMTKTGAPPTTEEIEAEIKICATQMKAASVAHQKLIDSPKE